MLGSAGCGASISSVSAQTIASARSGLVADLVTVTSDCHRLARARRCFYLPHHAGLDPDDVTVTILGSDCH